MIKLLNILNEIDPLRKSLMGTKDNEDSQAERDFNKHHGSSMYGDHMGNMADTDTTEFDDEEKKNPGKVEPYNPKKDKVNRGYEPANSPHVSEDLRKWFGKGGEGSTTGGGWDRYDSKGKKVGKCGDSKSGSAYAACLSKEKAAKLGADGRAAFVKRKRAAQSKAGDSKKGGEKSKGQKPTFVKTGASEGLEEKWSQKYKKSINCSNPKGFSQKAHCQGRKKNENMKTIEERLQLFLEKNCPTDPGKWAASKAAAKSKFDVYPSAYANGWAAKNYKSKGGGWRTCK